MADRVDSDAVRDRSLFGTFHVRLSPHPATDWDSARHSNGNGYQSHRGIQPCFRSFWISDNKAQLVAKDHPHRRGDSADDTRRDAECHRGCGSSTCLACSVHNEKAPAPHGA